MTDLEPTNNSIGRNRALKYCEDEIRFYSDVFKINHSRWKALQITTIVAGAVGTALAAVTMPEGFGWVRSIPVAIATISAGLNSSFSYQSESIRQGATADILNGEKIKFEVGASPYNNKEYDKNVGEFLLRIRKIIETEQRSWKAQVVTGYPDGEDERSDRPQ